MSLIRLVYVSAATKPFTPAELRELLSRARAHNSGVGISGLLLYHNRSFFQILEGSESEVVPLLARIEADARHQRVLLLSRQEVDEHNFGAWSMGFIDVEHTTAPLDGFVKLMDARSSFLDLEGDSERVAKLIDGFQEGRWRQSVES